MLMISIVKRFTELFEIPRYLQAADTACPKDHEESRRTEEETAESRLANVTGDEKRAALAAS